MPNGLKHHKLDLTNQNLPFYTPTRLTCAKSAYLLFKILKVRPQLKKIEFFYNFLLCLIV